MSHFALFVRLSCAATVLGLAPRAMAQQEGGPPLPKPSAEHRVLASDAGTWDAVARSYTGGPGAEPDVSKGTETNTVLAGGMWMLSEYKGEFGGMPFEGRGQFGYDPSKKIYVGTWIDSMTPDLSILEGRYDAKTRTMTYEGQGLDPNSKTKYTRKMVTVLKDRDHRNFTLLMKFDGDDKEMKVVEIDYTRRTPKEGGQVK